MVTQRRSDLIEQEHWFKSKENPILNSFKNEGHMILKVLMLNIKLYIMLFLTDEKSPDWMRNKFRGLWLNIWDYVNVKGKPNFSIINIENIFFLTVKIIERNIKKKCKKFTHSSV